MLLLYNKWYTDLLIIVDCHAVDANSTEIKSSSLEIYERKCYTPAQESGINDFNPKSSLRTRWKHKDDDRISSQSLDAMASKDGSHFSVRIILILSVILLFLILGLNWCLRSWCVHMSVIHFTESVLDFVNIVAFLHISSGHLWTETLPWLYWCHNEFYCFCN